MGGAARRRSPRPRQGSDIPSPSQDGSQTARARRDAYPEVAACPKCEAKKALAESEGRKAQSVLRAEAIGRSGLKVEPEGRNVLKAKAQPERARRPQGGAR